MLLGKEEVSPYSSSSVEVKKQTDAEKEQIKKIAADFLLATGNSKLSIEQKAWLEQEVAGEQKKYLEQLATIDQDIDLLSQQEAGGYGYSEYSSEEAKNIINSSVPQIVGAFQLKVEELASTVHNLQKQEVAYQERGALTHLERDPQYQSYYHYYSQELQKDPKKFLQSDKFNFTTQNWDGWSLPDDLLRQGVSNVLVSKQRELERGISNGQVTKATEKLAILQAVNGWLDSLKQLAERQEILNAPERNNESLKTIDQDWLRLEQKYQETKEYVHDKVLDPEYLREFDDALVEEYQMVIRKKEEKVKKINKSWQQEAKEILNSTQLQERQQKLVTDVQLLFADFAEFLEIQSKAVDSATKNIEQGKLAQAFSEQVQSSKTVDSMISCLEFINDEALKNKEKIIQKIKFLFAPERMIAEELAQVGEEKLLRGIPNDFGIREQVLDLLKKKIGSGEIKEGEELVIGEAGNQEIRESGHQDIGKSEDQEIRETGNQESSTLVNQEIEAAGDTADKTQNMEQVIDREDKNYQVLSLVIEQAKILIAENQKKYSSSDYFNKKDLLAKLEAMSMSRKQAEWALNQLKRQSILDVQEVVGNKPEQKFYRWRLTGQELVKPVRESGSQEIGETGNQEIGKLEDQNVGESGKRENSTPENQEIGVSGKQETRESGNQSSEVPDKNNSALEVVKPEQQNTAEIPPVAAVEYQKFLDYPEVQAFLEKLQWSDLSDPVKLRKELETVFSNVKLYAETTNAEKFSAGFIDKYLENIYSRTTLYLQQKVAEQKNQSSSLSKFFSREGKKFGLGVTGGAVYASCRLAIAGAVSVFTTVTTPISLVIGGLAGGVNAVINDATKKIWHKDQAQQISTLLKKVKNKNQEWPELKQQITDTLGELYLHDCRWTEDLSKVYEIDEDYQRYLNERLKNGEVNLKPEQYGVRISEKGDEQLYGLAAINIAKLAQSSWRINLGYQQDKDSQVRKQKDAQERQDLLKTMIATGELEVYFTYQLEKTIKELKVKIGTVPPEQQVDLEKQIVRDAQLMVENQMNVLLGDVMTQEKITGSTDGEKSIFRDSYLAKLWQDGEKYQSLGMVKKFAGGFASGAVAGMAYSNIYAGSIYGALMKFRSTMRSELSQMTRQEIIKTAGELYQKINGAIGNIENYNQEEVKNIITETKARIKLPDIKEHERILLENGIDKLRTKFARSQALGQITQETTLSLEAMAKSMVGGKEEQDKIARDLLKRNKKAGNIVQLCQKFGQLSAETKFKLLGKALVEGMKGGAAFALGGGLVSYFGGAVGIMPETGFDQVVNRTINGAFLNLSIVGGQHSGNVEKSEHQVAGEPGNQESGEAGDQGIGKPERQEIGKSEDQVTGESAPKHQEMTLAIGKDGNYQHGDQGFRHLMVEAAPKEIYQDGVVDAKDAAYLEYMLAVTRELAQGHPVAGFDPQAVQEFVTFDGKEIHISDYQKFETFIQGDLFHRAENVITDRSDVFAYVDDTSQKVWRSAFAEKGANIVVEDFSQDARVIAAEQRVDQQNEVVRDYQQHFNQIPHQGNIEVVSGSGSTEVKLVNGQEAYNFKIEHGVVTAFNGQELPSSVSRTEDLVQAVNHNLLITHQIPENKIVSYQQVAEKLGVINPGHAFVDPGDAKLLQYIEGTTAFKSEQTAPYQQAEIRDLAKDIIVTDGDKVLQYVDNTTNHFSDPKTVAAFSLAELREFGSEHSAELTSAVRDGVVDQNLTHAQLLLNLHQQSSGQLLTNSIVDSNPESLQLMLHNQEINLNQADKIQQLENKVTSSLELSADQVSQQALYDLQKAHITVEVPASNEIKINLPSDLNAHDLLPNGGVLIMEKVGGELQLHLETSSNKWLDSETSTFVPKDFWQQADEQTMINHFHNLVGKEIIQNKMASELELARQEQGIFSILTIDLDARYDRGFNKLSAGDVLISQENFVQGMNEFGRANSLPVTGQEDNLIDQYQIIHKYLTGGKTELINENMNNYLTHHQPQLSEDVRHYLGRMVGEVSSGVLPELKSNEPVSELPNLKDIIPTGELPDLHQTNDVKIGELPLLKEDGSGQKEEKTTTINDADKKATIHESKEVQGNTIIERSSVEAQMNGAVISKYYNEVRHDVLSKEIDSLDDWRDKFSEIKKEYTGNGELTPMENKSLELSFKSIEKGGSFVEDKIRMDVTAMLSRWNKKE